jgi:hypothetical protein
MHIDNLRCEAPVFDDSGKSGDFVKISLTLFLLLDLASWPGFTRGFLGGRLARPALCISAANRRVVPELEAAIPEEIARRLAEAEAAGSV